MKKIILYFLFSNINSMFILDINLISTNNIQIIKNLYCNSSQLISFNNMIFKNEIIIFSQQLIINKNSSLFLNNIQENWTESKKFLILDNNNKVTTLKIPDDIFQYKEISINNIESLNEFNLIFNAENQNIILNNNQSYTVLNGSTFIDQLHSQQNINFQKNITTKDLLINNIKCLNFQSNNNKINCNKIIKINCDNEIKLKDITGPESSYNNTSINIMGSINFPLIKSINIKNNPIIFYFINNIDDPNNIKYFLVLDKNNKLSFSNSPPPINVFTNNITSLNGTLTIENINELDTNVLMYNINTINMIPLSAKNLNVITNLYPFFHSITINNELSINMLPYNNKSTSVALILTNKNNSSQSQFIINNNTINFLDIYLKYIQVDNYNGNNCIYFSGIKNIFENIKASSTYKYYLVSSDSIINDINFPEINIKNIYKTDKEIFALNLIQIYDNIEKFEKINNEQIILYKKLKKELLNLKIQETDINNKIIKIQNKYQNIKNSNKLNNNEINIINNLLLQSEGIL